MQKNIIIRLEDWAEQKGGWPGKILAAAVRFFYTIAVDFKRNHCIHHAGYLAYLSLLALVPVLFVSFSIYASYTPLASFGEKTREIIYKHFLPGTGNNVAQFIDSILSQSEKISTSLGVIGFFFLIFIAVSLFAGVEKTFNIIWHNNKNRNPFLRLFVLWGTMTLFPAFLVLALYLRLKFRFVGGVYHYNIIPYLLIFSVFFFAYVLIPTIKIKIRYALISALIASIIWYYSRSLFEIYITKYALVNVLYGSISIIPVLLVWFYLSWIIVLFGVELNFVLQNMMLLRAQDIFSNIKDSEKLLFTIQIIYELLKGYKTNQPISITEISDKTGIPEYLVNEIGELLCDSEILKRTEDINYFFFSFDYLNLKLEKILKIYRLSKESEMSSDILKRTKLDEKVIKFYYKLINRLQIEDDWLEFLNDTT